MKIIRDEFTYMDITRQQRYQLRHERDGLCRLCCEKVATEPPGCRYCPKHLKQQRVWARGREAACVSPENNYNPANFI